MTSIFAFGVFIGMAEARVFTFYIQVGYIKIRLANSRIVAQIINRLV